MGVGTRTDAWRVSQVNKDYKVIQQRFLVFADSLSYALLTLRYWSFRHASAITSSIMLASTGVRTEFRP